jgi:hypothetical protein
MRFNGRTVRIHRSPSQDRGDRRRQSNRVLLATGQAHSEHRFCLVGSRFDDIQPKSEVAIRIVFIVPLLNSEWVGSAGQGRA